MTTTTTDELRHKGSETPVSMGAARFMSPGSTNKSSSGPLREFESTSLSPGEADPSALSARATGTPVSLDFWRASMVGIAAFSALLAPGTISPASAETGTALVQSPRVNHPRAETGSNLPSATEREVSSSWRPKRASGRGTEDQAVNDLKVWLLLNDSDIAELCGVSRRSLTNWRNGTSAYGASLRRLYSVHALVSHLGEVLGLDRALLWLSADDGTKTDMSRVMRLAEGEHGIRLILTQAEPILFPKTAPYGSFDVNAGLSEAEISQLMASARSDDAIPGGPPRRPRKIT